MHLNSWRAAGKKCRKRRPEGKMSHQVWMLHHVGLQNCIVQFFFVSGCTLAWGWQCMKIWRRRNGSKRSWKENRREKNWTEIRLKCEMNEWMNGKRWRRERAQLWTQAQRVCWLLFFGQQLTNVTQTERRLVLFNKNLKICTSLLAMIWLKVFSFSMSLFIFPFWVQSLQHGCWGVFFFF